MRRTGWTDTILVTGIGLTVLIIGVLLQTTGHSALLQEVLAVFTPLTALLLGIIGLRIYASRLETRDDRLHTLNLWLSIGLIMFSLAEIAVTLVHLTDGAQQMALTSILIQIPGLLLWGFGVIQYLGSLNMAFRFSESGRLWISLVIVSALATIGLILIMINYFADSYLLESVILSPIIIGLILFTIITGILVWIFRGGLLSRPLFFILAAFGLYLIRAIFWLLADFNLRTPFDALISTEIYILCGAALLLSKSLQSLKR